TQNVVGEHAVPVEGVPEFDPNTQIAQSEVSILFNKSENDELLFDNGSVFNIETHELLSVLQSQTLNMITYGVYAKNVDGYSMGDDFTLDNDAEIDHMDFYTYQTGGVPPTIIGAYIQVFDGDPSAGGSVIWGDMTTDRYYDSESTDGYRVLETNQGATDR